MFTDESVDQLRAAVEKGEVDKLRTLLRGSEGPSELTPLLQLACACTETGAARVELVVLLLDKGADPSEVGDGGSALWLAVAKSTDEAVSTLLEKATPEQRVAAARTLCYNEKWAHKVREVVEKAPKAWLDQIECILLGDAESICGDHAHLRPVQDGEGRERTLVRGKAGWADADGGAACELEAEVLSAFPLKYTVEFEAVKVQLREAVEKGEVDKLRTLLRGSEGPSELAPLLKLACACTETGAGRMKCIELLLEKGADPSEVGDGGSALWLAVEKGTSGVVSTLLEKATPGQRAAAARTLCEGGSSALDARRAAGKGLEHVTKAEFRVYSSQQNRQTDWDSPIKAWLEQAQRVAGVPLDAAPGSRVELEQLSGDGEVRTLVRRAEGGWCGEGGTVCDLADEVLGQYPLAVLVSTACQWHIMCDTCGGFRHVREVSSATRASVGTRRR